MPRAHCTNTHMGIIGVYLVANALIALSYIKIPFEIRRFTLDRTDLPPKAIKLLRLFGMFIFWCGLGHAFSIVMIWKGLYGIEALILAMTAIVSVRTALSAKSILEAMRGVPTAKQIRQQEREALTEEMNSLKAQAQLLIQGRYNTAIESLDSRLELLKSRTKEFQ